MDRTLDRPAIGLCWCRDCDAWRSADARRARGWLLDWCGRAEKRGRCASGYCVFDGLGPVCDPPADDLGSPDDARTRGLASRCGVIAAPVPGRNLGNAGRAALAVLDKISQVFPSLRTC